MTNLTNSNQTTAICDFCILQDIYTTDATSICETCHLNCCDDCTGDNYNLDHARVDRVWTSIINRECLAQGGNEMIVQYKTVRGDRWVFANGEEVGTIQPMLSAAGKWAYIPIAGYGFERDSLFKNVFFGNTIGAVRSSISHQVRRLA